MIMADILFWIAVAIGLLLTYVAHWLAAQALAPVLVSRCAQAYEQRPWACCLWGVLIGLPVTLVLAAALDKLPHPLLKALAVGALAVVLVLAFIGSAGLARRIGLGLAAGEEPAGRTVLRGGTVLGLTFLAPVLGWFVLMPLAFLSGLGAWLIGRRG